MLLQVLNMAQLQGSMRMAPGPQVVARESGTVQSAALPQRMSAIEKTFSDPAVRQLAHAVEAADFVAIDPLLAQGANVRAVGEQGMTLTHYALRARTRCPEILRRLLQAGAYPVSLLASGELKTALKCFCATEGGKRGRDPLPGLVDEWKQLVAALARRGVAMPCGL